MNPSSPLPAGSGSVQPDADQQYPVPIMPGGDFGPELIAEPTHPESAPKEPNWLLILGGTAAAVLLLGVGVIIGSALGSGGSDAEDRAGSTFAAATQKCTSSTLYATVGDEGKSLTLAGRGEEDPGLPYTEIACILVELKTPDAVISQMDSTRALDGRQSAQWDDIQASWTYHPNSGLQVILTISD